MNYSEVILSDNEPCKVRRLGIFELDQFRVEIPGPFTYKMKTHAGEEYEVHFDISRFEEPPPKPELTQAPEHGTSEWYDLRNYELYQAAKSHEKRQFEARQMFYVKIVQHILTSCINRRDIQRITSVEDWKKVHTAALVPQLTREHLSDAFNNTYHASFEEMEIFAALETISKGGGGMYDAIRKWENQVMLQMRMTELEYALLPVDERARKVCGLILDDLLSALEMDRSSKERERNASRKH